MTKDVHKNKYAFLIDKNEADFRTVVIMGVNRSGKTTLGNIIATGLKVEYIDEPWLLHSLPLLVKFNKIKRDMGRELFTAYLRELINDRILLRRANFRPNDLSSIWSQKSGTEIFSRLISLKSRSDVTKYLKKNNPLNVITLSETPMWSLPTVVEYLPGTKIIHVVRNGMDVAMDIDKKDWFSNKQLIDPVNIQIYRQKDYKGKTFNIPWWVKPKDDITFLEYSEFERALFYWCALMEKASQSLRKIKNDYIQVRYEDFVADPNGIIEQIEKFLRIHPTAMTPTAINKVYNPNKVVKKYPKIADELLARVNKINKYYGYKSKAS